MSRVEENARVDRQLSFLLEADKLKKVERRSILMDGSRNENSAEHSWHVALAALALAQHAGEPVDVNRVIRMLLVHDIVEIDAGDTFAYDTTGRLDQHAREEEAARRLFGLLPEDQAEELMALWVEFERRESAESRYANAIDRLLPVFHNYAAEGGAWLAHGISRSQVLERVGCIEQGAPSLWGAVRDLIDEAVAKGYLHP